MLVLAIVIVHVLVNWDVLHVVVILLFATQSKLSALVQLVGIPFTRNVHHYHVFAHLVEFALACWTIVLFLVLSVHAHVTIICWSSNNTAVVDS